MESIWLYLALGLTFCLPFFALKRTLRVIERAANSILQRIPHSWEVEEIVAHTILSTRDLNIKAYLNLWFIKLLVRQLAGPNNEETQNCTCIRITLAGMLKQNKIMCDVRFMTRDEVKAQWHGRLERLSPSLRIRFEDFLDPKKDGEDGSGGNVIRLLEWKGKYLEIQSELHECLQSSHSPAIILSGPVIPVLMICRKVPKV